VIENSHIIRQLYVYNILDIPVYLEDLDLVILPNHFVNLYNEVDNASDVEDSDSLEVALSSGLLEVMDSANVSSYTDSFSAQSIDTSWTEMYMQIASVGTSSYTVLEPVELSFKISNRTNQFDARVVNTGGSKG